MFYQKKYTSKLPLKHKKNKRIVFRYEGTYHKEEITLINLVQLVSSGIVFVATKVILNLSLNICLDPVASIKCASGVGG